MENIDSNTNDKDIHIYQSKNSNRGLFIIDSVDDEADNIYEAVKDLDINLIVIDKLLWNDELSPYKIDQDDSFKGGAASYLKELEDMIIPCLLQILPDASFICIGGYSLAGLFSLYCGINSDNFDYILSASGSLWYPSFIDYCKEHPLSKDVKGIYLSLGNKEKNTKNELMKTVEKNTEKLYEYYKGQQKNIFYELNEGGHFKDPISRLKKGIIKILEFDKRSRKQ